LRGAVLHARKRQGDAADRYRQGMLGLAAPAGYPGWRPLMRRACW